MFGTQTAIVLACDNHLIDTGSDRRNTAMNYQDGNTDWEHEQQCISSHMCENIHHPHHLCAQVS